MKIALTSDIHYGHSKKTANIVNKFCIKLKKENPDIIVLAGDLASIAQYQYKKCLETFRDHFPDTPLLVVRGNHDMWDGEHKEDKDSNNRSLSEIYRYQNKVHTIYNIDHLNEPFKIGAVTFFGFDGWYHKPDPGTNDEFWMPRDHQGCPTMVYLSGNSFKDFDRVLEQYESQKNGTNILVSHFPSILEPPCKHEMNASPGFVPEIASRFDYCMNGHTHQYLDNTVDGCRFLNSGSHYDDPRYIIITV